MHAGTTSSAAQRYITCSVAVTSGCPQRRSSPSPFSSLLEPSSSVRARLAAGTASSDIVLGHLIVRLQENSSFSMRETCAKTPCNIFLYHYIGDKITWSKLERAPLASPRTFQLAAANLACKSWDRVATDWRGEIRRDYGYQYTPPAAAKDRQCKSALLSAQNPSENSTSSSFTDSDFTSRTCLSLVFEPISHHGTVKKNLPHQSSIEMQHYSH